jgi:Spy/CpxP family protein refolding chaperone
MRTLPVVASLLTAALISIPAVAQPTNPNARPIQTQHQAQKGAKNQRGAAALRQAGVDEARIKKIETIREKYAEQRKKVREQAKPHRDQLKTLLEKNSTDESAYQSALDGLEKAKAKMESLRDRERAEIKKVLKPSEQAKLLAGKHRAAKRGKPGNKPRARANSPRDQRADAPRGPRDQRADAPRGPRPAPRGPAKNT